MKNVLLLAVVFAMANLTAVPVFANDAHHTAAAADYVAKGEVMSVDRATGKLKLKHDAVPELKWPGMTMDFPVADKSVLEGVKPGQKVEFRFDMTGGAPRVTRITPIK